MAAVLFKKMKELDIDEPLLRYFDHESWKMAGVENAILRSRLLRRQQQVGLLLF